MSISIIGGVGSSGGGGESYDQSLNTTDDVAFSSVTLPNSTQLVVGSLDNMTGGANGISLICAVGYELNWQGGRLVSVLVGGDGTPQTIYCDSPWSFQDGVAFAGTVTGLTKAMVGLGNADNTADASKPVSTAQAAADAAVASAAAADATSKANAAQAAAVQRANHTGTQAIGTVSGLQAALDGKQPAGSYLTAVPDNSVNDAKIDPAGLSASSINWNSAVAWAPSTSYAKGALVHYLGITYRRSVAGTSGSTFSAANWQQMTAPINVVTTPAQLTGNVNDYALSIATADIFRISSDAARNITGITAGLYDGHAVLLRNVGSFAITLKHQDTGSTAANRIISPWAGDVVISANSSMLLLYDNTLARWVVT